MNGNLGYNYGNPGCNATCIINPYNFIINLSTHTIIIIICNPDKSFCMDFLGNKKSSYHYNQ